MDQNCLLATHSVQEGWDAALNNRHNRLQVDLKKNMSKHRKQPTINIDVLGQGTSPGEQTEKKLRPRSCKVWEYFKQRPKNMVLSKLCSLEMIHDSNITAVHEHLKLKQPGALCKNDNRSKNAPPCLLSVHIRV